MKTLLILLTAAMLAGCIGGNSPRYLSTSNGANSQSFILAGTDSGLWLSTNLGIGWAPVNDPTLARVPIRSIALGTWDSVGIVRTELVVACGSKAPMYRSIDSGRSWIATALTGVETIGSADFDGGRLLLAMNDNTVRSTTDCGRTWSAPVPLPAVIHGFERMPQAFGDQVYAATDAGVYIET